MRICAPYSRFFQASTSEMYGKVQQIPQTEATPFYPCNPYWVAKLYAHWMTINYQEYYQLFACCGILLNHESPLRGQEFVNCKISNTSAKIAFGQPKVLEFCNLHAQRDWGYAKDYVQSMWAMLQQAQLATFVFASN